MKTDSTHHSGSIHYDDPHITAAGLPSGGRQTERSTDRREAP